MIPPQHGSGTVGAMRRLSRILVPALAATAIAAPGMAAATPADRGHGLRIAADADRNGVVDQRDLMARNPRPATYLPNLDDDSGRCARAAAVAYKGAKVGVITPAMKAAEACNDASDARVNGVRDAADLARVRVLPDRHASPSARVVLRLAGPGAPNSRLFVHHRGKLRPAATVDLDGTDLRRGIIAAVEGKGLVPTARRRDVRVEVAVTDSGRTRTSAVALRLAPFRLQHDLLPAQRIAVLRADASQRKAARGVSVTTADRIAEPELVRAEATAGPANMSDRVTRRTTALNARGHLDYLAGMARALRGTGTVLVPFASPTYDQWIQDQFEPGFVTMPAADGRTQRMRVLLRTTGPGAAPRATKAAIYSSLPHRDLGVADVASEGRDPRHDPGLDDGGNLESLPPQPGDALGTAIIGSDPSRRPDRRLMATLRAQTGQRVVTIDTSWLAVGHVDETLHVFPAPTPRGFTVAFADPRLGVGLLRRAQAAGHGGARFGDPNVNREGRTIAEMLSDRKLMRDNETAAGHIDRQIGRLVASGRITRDEIVRLPVLMSVEKEPPSIGAGGKRIPPPPPRAGTVVPDVVNGVSVNPHLFLAPAQHTVSIDGRDLFEAETADRLGALGVQVRFVEDRLLAHAGGGDVHCASNALRVLPAGDAG